MAKSDVAARVAANDKARAALDKEEAALKARKRQLRDEAIAMEEEIRNERRSDHAGTSGTAKGAVVTSASKH